MSMTQSLMIFCWIRHEIDRSIGATKIPSRQEDTMAKETKLYQSEDHGWYIESCGQVFGPMESSQDAHEYLKLLERANAARTEVACLDKECF